MDAFGIDSPDPEMDKVINEAARDKKYPDWKRNLHTFLRDPESSGGAKTYCNVLDVLVLLSILSFLIESVPAYSSTSAQKFGWFCLECVVSGIFIVDFLLKVISQQSMQSYLLTRSAVIDIISFLPLILDILWFVNQLLGRRGGLLFAMGFLRFVRCMRFSRLPLGKDGELGLFIMAVRRSRLALIFVLFYLFGIGLFFSSCIYYVETRVCTLNSADHVLYTNADAAKECVIQHMFDAIWVTIVTMTTVGYGDKVPATPPGKFLAGLLMVCSLIMIPLPVSIFSANLIELYIEYCKTQKRLENEGVDTEVFASGRHVGSDEQV